MHTLELRAFIFRLALPANQQELKVNIYQRWFCLNMYHVLIDISPVLLTESYCSLLMYSQYLCIIIKWYVHY